MATINDYFEQSQLSLAAYALDLTGGMSGSSPDSATYIAALKVAGLTQTQAESFANQYKVIDQSTDPVSGFSGTVFKDASGKIFMAMRGTENPFTSVAGIVDWSANIANIGSDGIAINQGIAMYNWYQRLITPVKSTATQYIYHKETTNLLGQIDQPAYLEKTSVVVTDTGANAGGGLVGASNVAVTGHSLGGQLAMMMSRIAPGLVHSVTTYNAPGFDTNLAFDWSTISLTHLKLSTTALTSKGFFDLLRNAENKLGPSQVGTGWNTGAITNFRVQGDAASLIGNVPGGQSKLFSENIDTGPINSHSIKAITDSLAVYDLFAKVDANLSIAKITGILTASSNVAANSLESAVSSLGELFLVPEAVVRGNAFDGTGRDKLYTALKAFNTLLTGANAPTVA